ncbi:MAG TPA: class I SAM-dependent methyltransferase [Thermoanaerobaculia bacterium]|jgi:Predicted O-methyltransferase|nr:class I SAM-dependent methyltransferase [Thermoanaerobaculia bacterium]
MKRDETFSNLRLAKMELARHYLLRHPELLNRWVWLRPFPLEPRPFLGWDFLLSHSWLPGMVELSEPQAHALLQLISGEATAESGPEHAELTKGLREMGWLEDTPIDLDALVAKAQDIYPAVQNPRELHDFLTVALDRRPKAVVEIGTAAGGTLYCMSQVAEPSALIVSIDFFGGAYGGGQTNLECKFFSTFGPLTQRFEFIRERSFLQTTVRDLKKILNGQEVELLFIDGDHSYAAVRSDYEMYHPFVAEDGLIVFHDILEIPAQASDWQRGNEVSIFWRELSPKVTSREIIDRSFPPSSWNGREPLSRIWPPLGIGIVLGNSKPT